MAYLHISLLLPRSSAVSVVSFAFWSAGTLFYATWLGCSTGRWRHPSLAFLEAGRNFTEGEPISLARFWHVVLFGISCGRIVVASHQPGVTCQAQHLAVVWVVHFTPLFGL
jgi:hypothetical protein